MHFELRRGFPIFHLNNHKTMSRVVHFEIPAVNGKKSVEFYKEVFGWEASQFGEHEYWLVNTGDEREPGINGAIMTRKDQGQPVVCTIG